LLNIEPDGAFYEEMLVEEAIRMAASLCTYAIEDGISCSLRSNARDVLTCDAADIPAGQTIQHNDQIQEQLGRLDLALQPDNFAAILADELNASYSRPVLVLISLNCSPGICDAWQTLLARGSQGIWVMPRMTGHQTRLPEIDGPLHVWEVNHGR